jgi:hypothetical protein
MSSDPITVYELSKIKTKLPVDLGVIDINDDYIYQEDKITNDNIPSRLIMQNNYDDNYEELVYISISKDNPKLLYNELNISRDDFYKVQEFIKKYYNDFVNYFNKVITIKELREVVYI